MPNQLLKSAKELNFVKGRKGEAEACQFLKVNGYKIIDTNYKTKIGEIDIVAKDKEDRIIFVEVKSRETARFGYPRDAVTKDKQRTIRRVAELYLIKKRLINSYTTFNCHSLFVINKTVWRRFCLKCIFYVL